MKGFIPAALVGAFVAALFVTSSDSTGVNSTSDAVLSGVFPAENVPQPPFSALKDEEKEQQSSSKSVEDSSGSTSQVRPQFVTQIPPTLPESSGPGGDNGGVYKYEVPLNSEAEQGGQEGYFGVEPVPENERGQVREFSFPPFPDKYKQGQMKQKKKKWEQTEDKERLALKEKRLANSGNGNDTQIQGAGTGLLQVSHPHNPYELHQQPYHHDYPHNLHPQHEVEVHPNPQHETDHGFIPIQEPHLQPLPHQPYHPHQHFEGQGQDFLQNQHLTPAEIHHQKHKLAPHHEIPQHPHPVPVVEVQHIKPLPKPLKPSIVHRDPHDHFDIHDKVRTQDGDKQVHHYDLGNQYPVEGVHGLDHFQPYVYDMKKVPECAHKNKHFYNLTFCLEDHLYPHETILWALHKYGDIAHKLFSDVTYQSADNLVTGLTKAEEEGYTYKHYFGANHAQHTALQEYKPPYHGYKYKTDYYKHGGYICPSDIYYGRPRRAMNTYGQWKVIVNVDHVPKHPEYHHAHGIHKKRSPYYEGKGEEYLHQEHHNHQKHKSYTQTLRLEQCIYANAPCSYIDPYFHSRCIQKHNFVRLVAWTLEEGLHVDTFKMPIACSCHIPQPIHFYQEAGHHHKHLGKSPVNNYISDHK